MKFFTSRRTALIIPLLCGILSGTGQASELQSEEYAVYQAILNHGLVDDVRHVIIAQQTHSHSGTLEALKANPESAAQTLAISPELVQDFIIANGEVAILSEHFEMAVDYVLLDNNQINALFTGTGWQAFYDRYPGAPGIVRLSRVGFDAALQHALVLVEQICGTECGAGRLVHAHRSDRVNWQVISGELVWMAAPESPE